MVQKNIQPPWPIEHNRTITCSFTICLFHLNQLVVHCRVLQIQLLSIPWVRFWFQWGKGFYFCKNHHRLVVLFSYFESVFYIYKYTLASKPTSLRNDLPITCQSQCRSKGCVPTPSLLLPIPSPANHQWMVPRLKKLMCLDPIPFLGGKWCEEIGIQPITSNSTLDM